MTRQQVSKTIDFCLNAFEPVNPKDCHAILGKLGGGVNDNTALEILTEDELHVLRTISAREILNIADRANLDQFTQHSLNGFIPNLKRGSLGLVPVQKAERSDRCALFDLFERTIKVGGSYNFSGRQKAASQPA
jgi:flavine halogenase